MEQDTLENLGFSLDLIYLANGVRCQNAGCGGETAPPEVEQLEEMLRAVLTAAETE